MENKEQTGSLDAIFVTPLGRPIGFSIQSCHTITREILEFMSSTILLYNQTQLEPYPHHVYNKYQK